MSDDVVWGVADFLCVRCGSTLLLVSPPLDFAETNLTGQSAARCTSCGQRTPARDLPQARQSQIAGRLRHLIDDDDFLHVSKALNRFITGSSTAGRTAAGLTNDSTDTPSSEAGPDPTSPKSQAAVTQQSSAEALRQTGDAFGGVDTSVYQLFAKLGAAEAKLLGAVHEMPIGEVVKNRKRDPNFSVARLRIPIVEPAFFTEIEVELVRYKASGRRNSLGFSLDEIKALRRGLTARRDVIPTQDSMMNTVGLLRFHRMKGGQVAAVEVYRRRSGPKTVTRPLA